MPLAFEASWSLIGILFAIGILMAIAEIFIPSHGILTVLAIGGFVAAVVVGFMLGQTPGLLVTAAVVLLTPVLLYVAVRIWPHTPIAKRLILSGPQSTGKAADLAHLDPAELIGKTAMAKTMLRPTGKISLGDRTLDGVTEGDLVPAGRRVVIIRVQGPQVVVRAVEEV